MQDKYYFITFILRDINNVEYTANEVITIHPFRWMIECIPIIEKTKNLKIILNNWKEITKEEYDYYINNWKV